jgi:hypothetical protein
MTKNKIKLNISKYKIKIKMIVFKKSLSEINNNLIIIYL